VIARTHLKEGGKRGVKTRGKGKGSLQQEEKEEKGMNISRGGESRAKGEGEKGLIFTRGISLFLFVTNDLRLVGQ